MAQASVNQKASGNQQASQAECPVGVGSPISNEAYDIITALHSKLEGLEAYRKYAKDGNDELWRRMTESDVACVETLCQELERVVRNGGLRMHPPGRAS
jgi:hypothetical protein